MPEMLDPTAYQPLNATGNSAAGANTRRLLGVQEVPGSNPGSQTKPLYRLGNYILEYSGHLVASTYASMNPFATCATMPPVLKYLAAASRISARSCPYPSI